MDVKEMKRRTRELAAQRRVDEADVRIARGKEARRKQVEQERKEWLEQLPIGYRPISSKEAATFWGVSDNTARTRLATLAELGEFELVRMWRRTGGDDD